MQNQIYGYALSRGALRTTNKLIYGSAKYKGNIIYGNILEKQIDMKFDVVIGNPPYQESSEKHLSSKSSERFWSKFIRKIFDSNLLKENGYLSLITPSGWLSSTAKLKKDIMIKKQIESICMTDRVKSSFNGVGGNMSFLYFVLKNTERHSNPEIEFNEKSIRMDILNNPICPSKSTEMYDFIIANKMIESSAPRFYWERRDTKISNENKWEITLQRAKSVNQEPIICNDGRSNVIAAKCGTKKNGERIKKIITTNIYKRILWYFRPGMAIVSNINQLPIPDIDIESEYDLFEYFQLDENTINFLENSKI